MQIRDQIVTDMIKTFLQNVCGARCALRGEKLMDIPHGDIELVGNVLREHSRSQRSRSIWSNICLRMKESAAATSVELC